MRITNDQTQADFALNCENLPEVFTQGTTFGPDDLRFITTTLHDISAFVDMSYETCIKKFTDAFSIRGVTVGDLANALYAIRYILFEGEVKEFPYTVYNSKEWIEEFDAFRSERTELYEQAPECWQEICIRDVFARLKGMYPINMPFESSQWEYALGKFINNVEKEESNNE